MEDDPSIVEIVRLGLTYEGVEVVVATNGLEAIGLHRETTPDLVLLDLMLPQLDGLSVLRRIRAARDTPVIVLTAKDELEDVVGSLQAGADDYVTKPFLFPELVARIDAVLRRQRSAEDDVIEIADLQIDSDAHEVTRRGRPIALTSKQFELLAFLARNARRVVSKQQIYENVWGWGYLGDANVVEQQISALRLRIDRGHTPKLIHTVRSVGYVLRDEEDPTRGG